MSQTVKLSRFLFNTQDGTLNEDAKLACQCLHIPHQKLIPKTLQDFKEQGVSDEIAAMRLQYYEDKRRVFTKQVEDTIKSGIIEDVKNEFQPQVKQPTAMNRTAGSLGRQQPLYGSTTSPRTVLSKHAMDFVHDYGLGANASTVLPPDVALRDPLDKEFVLNRKMAKKYYESQLQQRMHENRTKNLEGLEKKQKDLCDKEAKKEKAITELRQAEAKNLNMQVKSRREMEEERKADRARKARMNATEILRNARKEEQERVERERKKKADYDARLEEQFEKDRQYRELKKAKGDEAAAKERDNERLIAQRLVKTEHMLTAKSQSKEMQLKMIQEKALQRSQRIEEQKAMVKERQEQAELEQYNKYQQKIEKVAKKRIEAQKSLKAQVMRPDKVPTQERLAEIKKQKDQEQRDQARKIKQGIRQREDQVARNLSYLKEENDRRKEIKNLHKIDQEDNLQRKQAFERMGLENRVQMILEKASRVQKPAI